MSNEISRNDTSHSEPAAEIPYRSPRVTKGFQHLANLALNDALLPKSYDTAFRVNPNLGVDVLRAIFADKSSAQDKPTPNPNAPALPDTNPPEAAPAPPAQTGPEQPR